jgi:hypothetical protein
VIAFQMIVTVAPAALTFGALGALRDAIDPDPSPRPVVVKYAQAVLAEARTRAKTTTILMAL